jgi:hypothetical protein
MSLDDDNHASAHLRVAALSSMERDVHDPIIDMGETALADDVGGGSHSCFDDDEDSFCAAEDDCAPDTDFLNAILEEYHPERVNLLDRSFPETLTKPKQEAISHERRLSRSLDEGSIRFGRNLKQEPEPDEKEKDNTKQTSDKPEEPATNGTTAMDVESPENTETPEQTSEKMEAEESEDTFSTAAQSPSRPQQSELQRPAMEQTADTTKKSFRSINAKNFWSKSFRRVARSMKRGTSEP